MLARLTFVSDILTASTKLKTIGALVGIQMVVE